MYHTYEDEYIWDILPHYIIIMVVLMIWQDPTMSAALCEKDSDCPQGVAIPNGNGNYFL